MDEKGRLIVTFLVVSIFIGIASYFILGYFFSTMFAGYPGIAASYDANDVMSAGIAAAAFSIMFLMYPVIKYGDNSIEGDDFR
ncbi:MAG: hypothetical protein M1393_00315 [Candidatus Thermoplasmatota archaeon]|nr:hypothetical protein [Candidatus Thermoplasmatota archaeon]MCL6089470.1 hypothetical protein [Candidatus Thermoplasmatota archaeon]MDA8143646.1 hypothetical protein [Thermoplasmatales archaeon]